MKKIKAIKFVAPAVLAIAISVTTARAQLFPDEVPLPDNVDNNFPTQPHPGRYTEHVDQKFFLNLINRNQSFDAFEIAQDKGDAFFDNLFLADRTFGGGANVGQGQRYTRVPRADLTGTTEWANHFPARATGPNAASCIECHTMVRHDGSGFAALNAIRDPLHSGNPASFVSRNTPHLFGQGALQLLAEEMTAELQETLAEAKSVACDNALDPLSGPGSGHHRSNPGTATRTLFAKGTNFGSITVTKTATGCRVDTSRIEGIDPDLVVKPFQWKGSVAFIRDFNRGAAHNENGQQAVEIVGDGVDGDGDGVVDEVSVGDMTALTVYVASQPRPVTKIELEKFGKITPISQNEKQSIARGANVFARAACVACHTPMMKLKSPIFSEPSQSPFYRDAVFPAGQDPVARGLDPKHPIRFDLTKDVINGFANFQKDRHGMTKVELFSDLKRHDLGPEDAESIDEAGTGKSNYLTKALWGVGSTAPYMHDGRATTIAQAVQSHGGEASNSRAKYNALSTQEQKDLEAYLMNLRVYKPVDIDS